MTKQAVLGCGLSKKDLDEWSQAATAGRVLFKGRHGVCSL